MRLKDKVSIVTGDGSGINRAISILFAREGSKVVVVDIDEKGGKETLDAIKKNGGEFTLVIDDI